jgi:hypothetical protein
MDSRNSEGLESADCIAVILSPDAKNSDWVNRELEYAALYEVKVFPILAKGSLREAMPINLVRSQFIDIREKFDLNELIMAINELMKPLE